MSSPPIPCQTFGYLPQTYERNTLFGPVIACSNLNVDSVGTNALFGITENVLTGSVATGLVTSSVNFTVGPAPELSWVRIGNGVVLDVIISGLEGAAGAGVGTAIFVISSTGVASDLFVPSGSAATTQYPLRASWMTTDTAGLLVNTTITVDPPPLADNVNTWIVVVWTPATHTAGSTLTAARQIKYDTATYFQ